MIYCKDKQCEACSVRPVCVNVPPCTEQELNDLSAKMNAVKKKAKAMGIDPRELMRTFYD